MAATRRQRHLRVVPANARQAPAVSERLSALQRKYSELWAKHRLLVRLSNQSASERSGVFKLAMLALRASDAALAIAGADHVLYRNARWNALERDGARWRATARDPSAPATAPTLAHLAAHAARALLARSAPARAAGRYERPSRGDVFDVRFERSPERTTVAIVVRDVTRLVNAERELALAKRALEALCGVPDRAPRGGQSRAERGAFAPDG